jgi:transposase
MTKVQILTGVERRRRWSEEQKREIVKAAFAPGAKVSEVARQADVHNAVIYKWREELRQGTEGFAKVAVIADGRAAEERCCAIEVAIGHRAQIRIPASTPPDLAAAVMKALVRP